MVLAINRPVLLCIFVLSIMYLGYQMFWVIYLRDVSANVKTPVKAVVKSYYLSRITGGYWENEFELQADRISNFSQNERIDFYKYIILATCDIDTSKAIVFVDKLGKDAKALRFELMSLKASDDFNNLTSAQQEEVIDWIDGLGIVVKQKEWFGD